MHIKVLGFNLFAKGGTSRSNINLIKAFIKSGYKVTYYNFKSFTRDEFFNIMIKEDLLQEQLEIKHYKKGKDLTGASFLILTRETFFYIAREVKQMDEKIKIIGEIHGPLAYITEDTDLTFEAIDAYRVSTNKIKEEFIEKYGITNVFSQYVDATHITLNDKPKNTKRNLLIKARFEDEIKDISYVIQLMNCIVNVKGYKEVQLYIKGYGPSETLYKNLVKYYKLTDNVHINNKEPLTYIYISASPYETLGYSILESIAEGNKVFIYAGKDKVLKDIYNRYNSVEFLEKNIENDCQRLIKYLNTLYTKIERNEDIEHLQKEFFDRNYANDFLKTAKQCMVNKKHLEIKKVKRRKSTNDFLEQGRNFYEKLKKKPFLRIIMQNEKIFNYAKSKYNSRKQKLEIEKFNKIEPSPNKIFIESFHGNNFSGDPKYLALYIKENYPKKTVYVSSRNSLVDIEIRNHDLIPVRFGSANYVQFFRESKYVFVNGNTLDRLYKHDEQVFIQTWHGLPLKRMVNDLSDIQERNEQVSAFLPRMQKWDYLLSSSYINTMLFKSAFMTTNNKKLKILEHGAPRNEYLLNSNDEEKNRIQKKYFFNDDVNKKYILFCPTWRKEKRENLSAIDLKALLSYLPDNYEIIVKLHPNEAHLRTKYSDIDKKIHCFYNEFVDIQELYLVAESMITDYSSTIFDYAHLNKPIILLQEDANNYTNKVGFYFDIFELGKFPLAYTNEKRLAQQLVSFRYNNYSKLTNRLLTNDNHNSSKKIIDTIFKEG